MRGTTRLINRKLYYGQTGSLKIDDLRRELMRDRVQADVSRLLSRLYELQAVTYGEYVPIFWRTKFILH